MNLIFVLMCCLGLGAICFINPESAVSVMLEGTAGAVSLCIKMTAVYALWMGILEVMDGAGLSRYLAALFRPVTKLFFRKQSREAQDVISMNLAANFLGMGGAATPLGIKAMELMTDGSDTATPDMLMFLIINVTSIQLLPATVIALRSAAGSGSASDIILPTLLATLITTLVGVALVRVFCYPGKKSAARKALKAKAKEGNFNGYKGTKMQTKDGYTDCGKGLSKMVVKKGNSDCGKSAKLKTERRKSDCYKGLKTQTKEKNFDRGKWLPKRKKTVGKHTAAGCGVTVTTGARKKTAGGLFAAKSGAERQ